MSGFVRMGPHSNEFMNAIDPRSILHLSKKPLLKTGTAATACIIFSAMHVEQGRQYDNLSELISRQVLHLSTRT